MAGSRKPGPLDPDPHAHEDLDDGTSARTVSPRPGPLRGSGLGGDRRINSGMRPRLQRRAVAGLKTLREGDFGADAKKLQALLNARLTPSPALRLDGVFGPVTKDAVTQYQHGASLVADGVVGNDTWFHLLKGDTVSVSRSPSGTPPRRTGFSAPPATEGIWEWPLDKKLIAVLERVPSRLPGRARDEFLGLLNLQNLALSLAIIAGFCLLSGGTALVLGFALLGIDASMSLAAALQLAALAATPAELDEAADELAHVVLSVGVATFLHGVGRIAKGTRGGGGTTQSVTKSAPAEVRPASKVAPPERRVPERPVQKPTSAEPVPSQEPAAKGVSPATAPKPLPIPQVSDPKLANLVNDLYKGAKTKNPIGTGSTADAVRNELATKQPTNGTWHSDKARQYINALNNWLRKNPNASPQDRLVAESLKRDLQSALAGN